MALELDPTAVPVSEPLQADRRRIAPGSQIIREFQNRQGFRHGDLFYPGPFPVSTRSQGPLRNRYEMATRIVPGNTGSGAARLMVSIDA